MIARRTLLVNMPFAGRRTPSVGLSLLKAALERDGLPCDIRYFNLTFAELIGSTRYDQIAEVYTSRLLGEWLFARELHGDRLPPAEDYFALGGIGSYDLVASPGDADVFSPEEALVTDMDALPCPDFDDFFAQARAAHQDERDIFLQFETARGCWWGAKQHCTFCGLNGDTMNFRSKSPARAVLSTAVLRLMRKGVSALQNIQLLRWCAEFGIRVNWLILYGFPGEDPEDYDQQARLVPLLTHLPPPMLVNKIFVSRFSPLFNRPEDSGICKVRAARPYHHAYPFAEDDLNKLACAFDFDYLDARDPETYTQALKRETARWCRQVQREQLYSVVDDEVLVIRDTRQVARSQTHRFSGVHRAIYEFCDEAHSRARIQQHLEGRSFSITESGLDEALHGFVDAGLMIHQENRFLSLAVDLRYRIGMLGKGLHERQAAMQGATA